MPEGFDPASVSNSVSTLLGCLVLCSVVQCEASCCKAQRAGLATVSLTMGARW